MHLPPHLSRPCLCAALLFVYPHDAARADLVWTLSEGAGDTIVGSILGTINAGSMSLVKSEVLGNSSQSTASLSDFTAAPGWGDRAQFSNYAVSIGDDQWSTEASSPTAHNWTSVNVSGQSFMIEPEIASPYLGMQLIMDTGVQNPILTIYMLDGVAPSGTIDVTGSFTGGSAKFSDLIPGTYSYGTLGTGDTLSLTVTAAPEPLTAGPCAAFLALAAMGSRRRPRCSSAP